jgi:mRNA-degrading endonuclease RelE of RelBE toxin-antitoxin system
MIATPASRSRDWTRREIEATFVTTYSIEVSAGAADEIGALRAFDRRRVLDAVERDLGREPTRVTRRRKLLHGVRPRFEHVVPIWQLRVGAIRVFYDVDEERRVVSIRAVRVKARRSTQEVI